MDGARTFRSSLNFLMAIAATGSIAYFAVDSLRPDLMQKITQAPVPSSAKANAPDTNQGWKLGAFIERFLESDRAYLSERGSRGGMGSGGISFRTSDSDAAVAGKRQAGKPKIREQFGRVMLDQHSAGQPGLSLFLPMNGAFPSPQPRTQTPPVLHKPAGLQHTGAKPQPPLARATAAAAPTAAGTSHPPAPKTAFREVVPKAPASQQTSAAQPAVRLMTKQPALLAAPPIAPAAARAVSNDSRDDDADAVAMLMDQARRDIRMAPYAFAAARAYRARYQRDSRSPVFASRMGDLQASLFDAIRERQEIGHTTILTEVQFGEEARAELAACLQASGTLERVVIAAREVRHQPETPAFMVSLRARQTKGAQPGAAEYIVDTAGPCLVPLFRRGSVSLFHASDEASALAVKKLEALTAAIVYERNAGPHAPAPVNAAAPQDKG